MSAAERERELPPEVAAIRTATAIARTGATRLARLRGEGARDALLWVLPSRLHLRDAQARQSLLLDESGRPVADVLVCADDEDYLLLLDGPGDPVAHVREHARARGGGDVEVIDHSDELDVIEVHGPWAWELVAEVLGPDLVALPYLNFFRIDEGICLRAGRTGEFGYHLIVPRATSDAVRARFAERGSDFDLREVGADALSLAGFENWFFDAAHVPEAATPIELQLQWRLASDREFVGSAAIERRRGQTTRTQVCMVSPRELCAGDAVTLEGDVVGAITRAALSHVRGEWIASALIEHGLAHGGIDRLRAGEARTEVLTTAPPLIDNRSLYVDPRRHSYRTRDELSLGPLVRPPRARIGTTVAPAPPPDARAPSAPGGEGVR